MAPNHDYGDIDCYGRPHDAEGNTIFEEYRRPGDEEIGPFDALAIAELNARYSPPKGNPTLPDGRERPCKLIATSPNMDCVPDIKCGKLSVRARRNGRFAWTDFTLWPQWYFPEHEHFVYVMRRPYLDKDMASHPLRIMWWDVERHDFIEEQGSCYDGLGKLCGTRLIELETFERELARKIDDHEKAGGRYTGWLLVCANAMRDAIIRLKYAPMTFRDLVYMVGTFQRQYLETRAYLDYAQKWVPRLTQALNQPPAAVDRRIMGCVTDLPEVVQKFHKLGVPVWYVRPPSAIPRDINIVVQVPVDVPPREYIVVDDWPGEPFPEVYAGYPCAELIRSCLKPRPGSLNWNRVKASIDPTAGPIVSDETPPESLAGPVRHNVPSVRVTPYPPASSSSASSLEPADAACPHPIPSSSSNVPPAVRGTNSRKVKNARMERAGPSTNKFLEPESDVMPPAIPVWVEALKGVDVNSNRRRQLSAGLFLGYQFPDPHLFLHTGRMERYLCAWLTVRSAWIQSILNVSNSDRLPMTQQWRNFLNQKIDQQNPGDRVSGPPVVKKTKKSAARRQERIAQEGAAIFNMRLPSKAFPKQVFWQEQAIQVGDQCRITPTLTAQVLWDLFEHNFRLELLALERTVMAHKWSNPVWAAERDNLVQAVFPGDGSYLVGLLPTVDQGLAAPSWQDRLPFVENFRVLVSSWDGEVPAKLRSMTALASVLKHGLKASRKDVENIEKVVVSHYCQTFFDWFGRAAICPHRLPPLSPS